MLDKIWTIFGNFSTKTKSIIVIVLGFVVFCCFLSLVGILVLDKLPTETEIANDVKFVEITATPKIITATKEPTSTSTNTPYPTNTPTKTLTNTPNPTNTPTKGSTSTPDKKSLMEEWTINNFGILTEYGNYLDQLNIAVQSGADNTFLLLSNDYVDLLDDISSDLVSTARLMKNSNCPDEVIDNYLNQVYEETVDMKSNLMGGLKALDGDLLTKAGDNMTNIGNLFGKLTERIKIYQ